MHHSRRIRRAAALAIGVFTLLGGGRAFATPSQTVLTDPPGDVTGPAGQSVTIPRIDLLDVALSESSITFTVALHVADLDAPVTASVTGQQFQEYRWGANPTLNGPTLSFTADNSDGGGQRAVWTVADSTGNSCSGSANVVFDAVTDTVTMSAGLAVINACPLYAGTPLQKGTVLQQMFAATSAYDEPETSFVGVVDGRDTTPVDPNVTYTLQH